MAQDCASNLPLCSICWETLGKYGGPGTLPCGHNGCLDCLRTIQTTNPLCPLCRAPFEPEQALVCNPELRDLISLATSFYMDDKSRQDGWESFPDSQMTADHYAQELKAGRTLSQSSLQLPGPSAPMYSEDQDFEDVGQESVPTTSAQELLCLEPPQWLPDSFAASCCSCHQPFKAITRLRHHCRMCGKIFCHACCHKRMLLPPKYRQKDPQRVCEMCHCLLAPLQGYIASNWSNAVQVPVQDAPDAVSLRSWLNSPYCPTLEEDLFKAANILRTYVQAARARPEASIPTAVLQGAKGLAVLSALKVGAGWSCTFGTGVVVSRQDNGEWSAPCAVACWGVGWGLQVGSELTDLLLVIRTDEALRAFATSAHLAVGGSVSAALGPLGRHAAAQLVVNRQLASSAGSRESHSGSSSTGEYIASNTAAMPPVCSYSLARGAFLGISLDTSMVTTRACVNQNFYGYPVTAQQLLLETSVPQPPAAALLYSGLSGLTDRFENRGRLVHSSAAAGG